MTIACSAYGSLRTTESSAPEVPKTLCRTPPTRRGAKKSSRMGRNDAAGSAARDALVGPHRRRMPNHARADQRDDHGPVLPRRLILRRRQPARLPDRYREAENPGARAPLLAGVCRALDEHVGDGSRRVEALHARGVSRRGSEAAVVTGRCLDYYSQHSAQRWRHARASTTTRRRSSTPRLTRRRRHSRRSWTGRHHPRPWSERGLRGFGAAARRGDAVAAARRSAAAAVAADRRRAAREAEKGARRIAAGPLAGSRSPRGRRRRSGGARRRRRRCDARWPRRAWAQAKRRSDAAAATARDAARAAARRGINRRPAPSPAALVAALGAERDAANAAIQAALAAERHREEGPRASTACGNQPVASRLRLARSGSEDRHRRHRAGVASMAFRTRRKIPDSTHRSKRPRRRASGCERALAEKAQKKAEAPALTEPCARPPCGVPSATRASRAK